MFVVNKSFIFLIIFLVFSITASVIDIRYKIIPDWIVFPGIVLLAALRIILFGNILSTVAINIITGPVFFLFVYFITHGKLGVGDIKYSALLGIFIGLPGLFIAVGLASVMGLIFAVTALATGTFHLTTKIPFAPFLTFGSLLTYFIFNSFI